jgi:hypothetical protein
MSAAKIIAQGVPEQIVSIPGVNRLPTWVHLRATIGGGAGVPTIVPDNDATVGYAGTTPGMGITRVSAGIYDVTLDGCRSIALGSFTANLLPATNGLAVAAELRGPGILDRTAANTTAKLGKLRVGFPTNVGGLPGTELGDGTEIHVIFLADFG